MKFLFVGDIMPGGVLHYQNDYIDSEISIYLQKFDVRIGTLECAVGNCFEKDHNKQKIVKPVVYALEEDLQKVKEMNFNYVSLANNHVFDLGIDGFRNTIEQLDKLNIKYFGAGANFENAKQPAVIKIGNGKTLAIIGCLIDYVKPVVFYPPSDDSPCLNIQNVDGICNDIAKAKTKYDFVIVMPHWGLEHIYFQPEFIRNAALKMIQSGADAIMGGHPHIVNPRVRYKGKDIFFSMGNLLFADRVVCHPRDMYYPDPSVFSQLSRKWCKPYPKCDDPFIAVWPSVNRVGMLVECQISDKIKTKYRLSYLSVNNILGFYHSSLLKIRLFVISLFYANRSYSRCARIALSHKNKLTILLDKISFPLIEL